MAVAVFNYATWSARYPELAATVGVDLATAYFGEAGLLLNNTDTSLVCDVNVRLTLLNMITAHIAALNRPSTLGGTDPQTDLVGRISNATEGSVSVATDYGQVSASSAYWLQTKYGAQYWQATAKYRTAHYRPGRRRNLGVPGFRGAGLGGWRG